MIGWPRVHRMPAGAGALTCSPAEHRGEQPGGAPPASGSPGLSFLPHPNAYNCTHVLMRRQPVPHECVPARLCPTPFVLSPNGRPRAASRQCKRTCLQASPTSSVPLSCVCTSSIG